jgi:MFS superfamily sulfate permease-like transporter
VREDYSPNGDAWNFFTHDHARSRAYRWGEDGIAGFSDDKQRLCLALALWNGKDPILKERLFGLTNSEGNHGEDVKEYYSYLDSTPTHSYMKYLYKYPQAAYPYADLLDTNRRRSRNEFEYELLDTGTRSYSDIERNPDNVAVPGALLLRVEAALLYFNVTHVHDAVWQGIRAATGALTLVLWDLSTSPMVDLAGARMLAKLHEELQATGIRLRLVAAHAAVRDILRAEGLEERVGYFGRRITVADAIDEFQGRTGTANKPNP